MTIRVWIQPPVWGMEEWMLEPKKPTSQRMNKITMIVHNMLFLLEFDVARRLKVPVTGAKA